MPYVVAETTDALGNKELLAAPDSWYQKREDGKDYLCWPNVRNITTLNALLQDDCSVPSLMWEKHECMIKRRNILSLALASKVIEDIQRQSEKINHPVKRVTSTSPDRNARQRQLAEPNEEALYEPQQGFSSDPLEESKETKLNARVSQMFNELKGLIDTNQDKMMKKMNEGFYRIQKAMVALMHKRAGESIAPSVTGTSASHNPPSNRIANFNVKPLKTVEEMNAFEERLNDEDYRKQMHSWIDSCVSYERNPECRMMEILDLLFDRHLLPNFSWTGVSSKGSKKHAFGEYKNIILLFVYVGTTSIHRADTTFVANFFMKKLRHAPFRAATLKGLRRCVPHSPAPRSVKRMKNINATESSAKFVKISRVEYGNVEKPEDSDENNDGVHVEYKTRTVVPQQNVLDHEYSDYKTLEIVAVNDLHPTLFMSAEDESD